MFDIAKYIPMLQNGLTELKHVLGHIYAEIKTTRVATEYEFGTVDTAASEKVRPRRLTSVPLIVEDITTAHADIDVVALNQGRAILKGQYCNLGDHAFLVTLIGVGGQPTARHTLPAGATLPILSYVAAVAIDVTDGPAHYQIVGV